MPNPLQSISDLLAEIRCQYDVLPASGGATADEAHPDTDEREEAIVAAGETIYDKIGESGSGERIPELYYPCEPLTREEDHLFRYFVDGSFRSYFLGTLVAPQWDSPVTFGQVGACVLHRLDDGTVERALLRTKMVLVIAERSESLRQELERRCAEFGVIIEDILEPDQLNIQTNLGDLREKAGGKVRWQMHLLEAQVIEEMLPHLSSDCWLIADGSLRFQPFQNKLAQEEEIAPVIGVAKSFRRDVRFQYGRGPRASNLTLYNLLSELQCAHRTVAFATPDHKVVFWYVRLREQKHLEYPLMGVIKAEMINPTGTAVPTELINRLSRALVAERNVTPHGRDRRWHAHLYPISLAETAVKESFLSLEVVRAALLWR
jgi:hypothetical protein